MELLRRDPAQAESRGIRARCIVAGLLAAALAQGCAGFDATPVPDPGPLATMTSLVQREAFARPKNLRPCCAFGHSLKVEVVEVPVPVFEVQNVVSPRAAGSHTYDGGMISTRNSASRAFVSAENNGLVYSCRGGFIDLAHVRDYADWTAFLAHRIDALLESGSLIDLGEEAGGRLVYVEAIPPKTIAQLGRRRISVALASWLAYQTSIWHEIATWYGYAAIGIFPERASAFSPEDLYSNLTGIELASAVLLRGSIETEADFNRAMDRALEGRLAELGAQPPALTMAAASAVDGLWWNSQARVPDMNLVLRRNFDVGPEVVPWLVPADRRPEALQAACHDVGQQPQVLEARDRLGELRFAERARLDLRVDRSGLDDEFPLPGASPWIDQRALPEIVAHARAANRERFGDAADRP